MTIQFRCACGARLSAALTSEGQEVECASCRRVLRVPSERPPQHVEPRPRADATPRAQPRPQAESPVRARAVAEVLSDDEGPAPAPRSNRGWLVTAGFAATLLAVGGVYFLMGQRVTSLEKALAATAEEGQRSGVEVRTQLEAEQKRAKEGEEALRTRLEAQVKAQQALTTQLRDVSRASDELRNKMDAEVARFDAAVKEAAARGADTATLVKQHETQLQSMRDELTQSLAKQGDLTKQLEAVTLGLDDLNQKYLAAAKTSAELAVRMQAGEDAIRTVLDAQQKTVDRLTKQVGSATGSAQVLLKAELAKAQRDLRDLEKKVAAGPAQDPVIQRLNQQVQHLTMQGMKAALGTDPSRGVAVGFRTIAGVRQTAVMTIDTANGFSSLFRFSPTSPATAVPTLVLPDPLPFQIMGTEPGRFEIRASVDENGDLDEFIRLDTQTGSLWRHGASPTGLWEEIGFFQGRPGPNHAYRLDMVRGTGTRSAGAIIPIGAPASFRDKAILVLTDTRFGGLTFSDWLAPRQFMLP